MKNLILAHQRTYRIGIGPNFIKLLVLQILFLREEAEMKMPAYTIQLYSRTLEELVRMPHEKLSCQITLYTPASRPLSVDSTDSESSLVSAETHALQSPSIFRRTTAC